ncbi:hypothetical protein AB0E69_10090 [Kribbella sp. NPDC026611]|uniref:hypothetical protein n=1 Tax=Kribbella sp. NPDC026611 TaxID=3154911 RepID=UPI0033F78EA4
MTEHTLTAAVVRDLIDAGDAVQLLPSTDVGPVSWDGQWWYVPSDAADDGDYRAAGPALAEQLDELRVRADRVAAVRDGEA